MEYNRKLHKERVLTLQNNIKEINQKDNGSKKIVTSRSYQDCGTNRNTTVYKDVNNKVKMDFKNILEINVEKRQ